MSIESEISQLGKTVTDLAAAVRELIAVVPGAGAGGELATPDKPVVVKPAASGKGKGKTKPAPAPEPDLLDDELEEEEETVTRDMIKTVLKDVMDKHGRGLASEILARQGAERIGEVKETQFTSTYKLAKYALENGTTDDFDLAADDLD